MYKTGQDKKYEQYQSKATAKSRPEKESAIPAVQSHCQNLAQI